MSTVLADERGRTLIGRPLGQGLGGLKFPKGWPPPNGQPDQAFAVDSTGFDGWPQQLLLTDDLKVVAAGWRFGWDRLNGDAYPKLTMGLAAQRRLAAT